MKALLLLLLVLNVTPAAADVFKCQIDGKTKFQDSPCATGETSEKKLVHQASAKLDYSSEIVAIYTKNKIYANADLIMRTEMNDKKDIVENRVRDSLRLPDAPSKSQTDTCFEKHRNDYVDPNGLSVVESALYENSLEQFVYVSILGKNAFGGPVRVPLICTIQMKATGK